MRKAGTHGQVESNIQVQETLYQRFTRDVDNLLQTHDDGISTKRKRRSVRGLRMPVHTPIWPSDRPSTTKGHRWFRGRGRPRRDELFVSRITTYSNRLTEEAEGGWTRSGWPSEPRHGVHCTSRHLSSQNRQRNGRFDTTRPLTGCGDSSHHCHVRSSSCLQKKGGEGSRSPPCSISNGRQVLLTREQTMPSLPLEDSSEQAVLDRSFSSQAQRQFFTDARTEFSFFPRLSFSCQPLPPIGCVDGRIENTRREWTSLEPCSDVSRHSNGVDDMPRSNRVRVSPRSTFLVCFMRGTRALPSGEGPTPVQRSPRIRFRGGPQRCPARFC